MRLYILILILSVLATNVVNWKIHDWKDGAEQTHAYQSVLNNVSGQLTKLATDQQASQQDSVQLANKIQGLQSTTAKLHEEFRNENAARTTTADCHNPFTPVFVQQLNTAPGSDSASGP